MPQTQTDFVGNVEANKIYRAEKTALSYKSIKGLENIDKIVNINQSPIGRTPRSNPATYCGVFSEIRNIFSKLETCP